MARKKVLLMGKARSGKTSMRSIIFANYLARDTMRLSPTLDVEHHHVRFLGDLVLNLWDCGGQDAFYESYFERDRETIFRSVEMLIYVFDIESDCPEKDFDHFAGVLEAIEENSPDARIFVLVHKMDLVAEDERDIILQDRKRLIEDSCTSYNFHFQCFGTSIWDETLYKAWSEIVTNLIPNIGVLESHLQDFCKICDADEVVLFEKATFLVISHSHSDTASDSRSKNHDQANNNMNHNNAQLLTENPIMTSSGNNPMDPTSHMNMLSTGSSHTNTAILTKNTSFSEEEIGKSNGFIDSTSKESLVPSETLGLHSKTPSYRLHTNNPTLDDEKYDTNHGTSTGKISSSYQQQGHQHHALLQNPNVIARRNRSALHFDAHRFEKISNIVKQFKLSCGKAQSQFSGMEVCNSHFSAYIDAFTANTYIMVIVSNPQVQGSATLLNIKNARKHFERFIPRS